MRFITPDSARKVALDCATKLASLLKPDGRFVYRYKFGGAEIPSEDSYSSVRHIGVVWFLLEAEQVLGSFDGVREVALKAGGYAIEHFLVPYAGDEALAVLSEGFAKLGGSGLALNALCRLWDATSDERYLDLAKKLAKFILLQQQDIGDFIQVRQYPLGVPHPARDGYAAGQAVLGLVNLFERTGDDQLLTAAQRAVKFLDTANYGVQTSSHWMLYALDKLYEHDTNPKLVTYAERIASRMMTDTAFRKAGLSTPIACRAEGLLAYERLLAKAGVEAADPRRSEVMRHVRQNISATLKYRMRDGAFVEGDKKPEVRIDFIVHPGRACLAFSMQSGSGN
jgi:hypothetical protein